MIALTVCVFTIRILTVGVSIKIIVFRNVLKFRDFNNPVDIFLGPSWVKVRTVCCYLGLWSVKIRTMSAGNKDLPKPDLICQNCRKYRNLTFLIQLLLELPACRQKFQVLDMYERALRPPTLGSVFTPITHYLTLVL